MFIVFLMLIQLCYAVNANNCPPEDECTVQEWREWENCSGNCKNTTKQFRKRTICVDFTKVQPFTRENVIQFCNITVPTVETRPCLTCPVGIYNVISQKCEKCTFLNGQIKMLVLLFVVIQLCSAKFDACAPTEECTLKSWREWENCSGNCKNITKQVRKRTICVDFVKVRPFTRENVIQFCNITVPTVETRPCPTCPVGIYNVISQKCEKCNYVNCRDDPCQQGTCNDTAYGIRCSCYPGYAGFDCGMMIPRDKTMTQYLLPLWLPPLEYAILTLTTLIIIMAAGCLCLKCCQLCGACSSDDDDDDDKKRKRKKKKPFPYRSHGSRNPRNPPVVIDF